jgi:hypothetical protein
VAFEALDNGVKSCANPKLMQRLCDETVGAPSTPRHGNPGVGVRGRRVVKVGITSASRFSPDADGRAAEQVRVRHQPENRQVAWHRGAANAVRSRRRGDHLPRICPKAEEIFVGPTKRRRTR